MSEFPTTATRIESYDDDEATLSMIRLNTHELTCIRAVQKARAELDAERQAHEDNPPNKVREELIRKYTPILNSLWESVNNLQEFGEWVHREDGFWVLRIPDYRILSIALHGAQKGAVEVEPPIPQSCGVRPSKPWMDLFRGQLLETAEHFAACCLAVQKAHAELDAERKAQGARSVEPGKLCVNDFVIEAKGDDYICLDSVSERGYFDAALSLAEAVCFGDKKS